MPDNQTLFSRHAAFFGENRLGYHVSRHADVCLPSNAAESLTPSIFGHLHHNSSGAVKRSFLTAPLVLFNIQYFDRDAQFFSSKAKS